MVTGMTRQECIDRSLQWLTIADKGYTESANAAAGKAQAWWSAAPTLAASIANAYATLAITADPDDA